MPLDPVIHQPTRLHILAALYRNRELSFRELRDGIDLTAGNLGSHLTRLIEAGYVASRYGFAQVGVEMSYRITEAGNDAMKRYLMELRALLSDLPSEATHAAAGAVGPAAPHPSSPP